MLGKVVTAVIVTLLMSAALCTVFAVYFVPPLWPKSLGAFDMRFFFGPHALLLDYSLRHGELPLWNPLVLCGTPLAGNPQASLFYPFHLLRSLCVFEISPFATSLSLHMELLLHLLFGGLCTYALARDYRVSRPAAFLSGLIFMCGPFAIPNAIEFWNLMAIASWLPLEILLTRKALHATTWKRRMYFAAAGGLAFGLSTLIGFPQLTFYSALTIWLFAFFDRLFALDKKGWAFFRQVFRYFYYTTVILFVLYLGAGLVAAAMLLPGQEFAGLSERISSSGLKISTARQDLTPSHLLMSLALFPGIADYATQGCRTAGICALLFIASVFFHERKRPVFVFVALFIVLADITLGPPLPLGSLLNEIDFFNFRSPWRAGLMWMLPVSMLAGMGADAATMPTKNRWGAIARRLVLAATGCAAILIVHWWLIESPAFTVNWTVLWLPVGALVLLMIIPDLPFPKTSSFILVCLAVAEVVVWGNAYASDYASRRFLRQVPEWMEDTPEMWADNSRYSEARPHMRMWQLDPIINGYDALKIYPVRQTLCAPNRENVYKGNLYADEVMVDNQRGNLFLKRSFWLARQYVKGPLPGKEALFPPTTTVYLPEADNLSVPLVEADAVSTHAVSEDVELVPIADEATLKSMMMPRVNATNQGLRLSVFTLDERHSVLRLRYTSDRQGALDVTFDDKGMGLTEKGKRQQIKNTEQGEATLEIPLPDFKNCSTTLLWPQSLDGLHFLDAQLAVDNADENQRIHIKKRTANTIQVELAELPGPRVLTYIDGYYPGWQAYVDDEPVPIMLANDAFKAVVVPAGTHEVRFQYRPKLAYLGITSTIFTMLLLGCFLVWGRNWRFEPGENT